MFTSGRHRRTWWHHGSVVFLSMFCQDYWWCAGIIRLRRDPITIPGKIWFYRAFGPAVGPMPSSIRTFISGLARDVSATSCLQPLAQSTILSLLLSLLFFCLFLCPPNWNWICIYICMCSFGRDANKHSKVSKFVCKIYEERGKNLKKWKILDLCWRFVDISRILYGNLRAEILIVKKMKKFS